MAETKRCPYCGEEIMATAKKCKHCGEWLTEESRAPRKETKACPICGEQMDADATVCPHCHEAVGAKAAAAPRTPQPSPRQAPQPARQQPRRLSDYMPYADRASDEQQADTGKAGMLQYYLVDTFFKHYADFRGAIGRKKFWMSYLFYLLAYCAVFGLDLLLFPHTSFLLTLLFSLGLIVPVLALMTRRLHDIGKSGGWIFISLVPFVGGIWLLLLLVREGRTQSRTVRAKGTDWLFIAAAALLLIVGPTVGILRMMEQQKKAVEDLEEQIERTKASISDESGSAFLTEAVPGRTFLGMSDSGRYSYYLNEAKDSLYQRDGENEQEYVLDINNASEAGTYIIHDYLVHNNKIFFIAECTKRLSAVYGFGEAFAFDMDNETWHEIDGGVGVSFDESRTQIKVTRLDWDPEYTEREYKEFTYNVDDI